MRLSIIILNYRTAALTIDCLVSLEAEVASLGDVLVIVVDNASADGSVERIGAAIDEHAWGGWVRLLPQAANGGYAAGNNAGIRAAMESERGAEHVLLLNSDTVVRPGAIASLLEFMDQHPDVGMAGSRLENPDGTPQRSAFRFPAVLGELESGLCLGPASRVLSRWVVAPPVPDEPCATDWVAGASMIIRRKVFDAIGLLDDGYFLYFEEVDFCLRARRAGWPCWYVPASRVVHLVGQSSGVTDRERTRRRRPGYWFDSRRRFFVKNDGRAKAALADMAWAMTYPLYRLRCFIQRKPVADPAWLWWDFVRHSVRGLGKGL